MIRNEEFPSWVNPFECQLKNGQNEVFDRLWYPLSILLLAAIGAKLIGPYGGLQVDKNVVTGSVE